MERVLPPAEERFDPITGRWINAPLPDPARAWVNPAGDAPVTVVGEIPPELSEHDRPPTPGSTAGETRATRIQRLRWLIIIVLVVAIIALGIATLIATA